MKLVLEDDPVLKEPTPEFDFSNPPVDPVALVQEMFDIMFSEKGVGLAAPQVGLLHRVFVMATDGNPRAIFNPKVLSLSPETERESEGCLSFPDLWLKIKRPIRIDVQHNDEFGNLVYETFENLSARCYLHETDHLNGVRFVDLVGPLALKSAKTKRTKRH